MEVLMSAQTDDLDVVTLVQRDHRQIEALLDRVESVEGVQRRRAFEDLVRKLAVHETAEEEVVHPVLDSSGASGAVEVILHEEDTAKKALAALDGADVSSDDFMQQFKAIRADVLAHARREETDEHPQLLRHESPEKLARMGRVFEIAEKTAPTHPHASAPESRAGNLILGPVLAVADRARDAIRHAMQSSENE
jgi:hemerythrin superfamily protein